MKKPLVPWTCGNVCRNSGRLGCRNCAQPSIGSISETGGVDDGLRLVGVDRADRVDDRAAGPDAVGRRPQELELQLGQRLGAPAQVGARCENAETGTGRVDERAVEARQLGRQRAAVGVDDTHVLGAEATDVLLQLARPRLVCLDRSHLAGEHRRLAAWRRAEVEDALACLRADDEPGELGASALRPDLASLQGFLVHPLDLVCARDVRRGPVREWAADMPDDGGRWFVLRPHQRQRRLLAEVAPPDLPDPVGVGVLERPLREAREQLLDPVADPSEHGVRERDRPLQPGTADELDRLVHGRVAGDAAEEAELVRAEAERREHRRVELPHGPLPERLDRVVERSHPLHRPERELPRERPVAVVELLRRRAKRPVGVGVILEDAPDHLVGGRAGGRDAQRRPRRNASYGIRLPPSGCTSTGIEPAVLEPRLPDREPAAVQLAAGADVRRQSPDPVQALLRPGEVELAVGRLDLGCVCGLALLRRERRAPRARRPEGRPRLRRRARTPSPRRPRPSTEMSAAPRPGRRRAPSPSRGSSRPSPRRRRATPARPARHHASVAAATGGR